eukprot:TRINITY_DN19871_c0_g1_i1.p1 TRINITY_DN19871_c0_g1~~TRINITY_DN19871_c0_g1_i1.p1  ORF type:complete len:353 (+),score=132.98 TRINITY_DN19871_c0_g1_i1:73-1059(+)
MEQGGAPSWTLPLAAALAGAGLLCLFQAGAPPPAPAAPQRAAPCPRPRPPRPAQSLSVPVPAGAADVGTRLHVCSNEVYTKHPRSLWTMLIGDNAGYIKAASRMLQSAVRHSTVPFSPFVLELRQKPLKLWAREALFRAGWGICTADRVPPPDEKKTFEHFRDQYSKFQLWRMTEFETVVYLDADTYVVGNIDSLLTMQLGKKKIGAGRDYLKVSGGWLDTFNMGVFVVHPNKKEHERMMSYHRGDLPLQYDKFWSEQAFLNALYRNQWHDIGWEHNANLVLWEENRGFWARREGNLRIVHYTMKKPWKGCDKLYLPICDWWTGERGL